MDTNTETMRSIKERCSVRGFKPEAVPAELIEQIKAAALAAPSGMNLRTLRFSFVEDRALIQQVSDLTMVKLAEQGRKDVIERMKERKAESIFYGAPLVVYISCGDSPYAAVDSGIAVQNMALAAQSLGLGSCIIAMCRSAFERSDERNLCAQCAFEDNEHFEISIAIGYPDVLKKPHEAVPGQIRVIRGEA